MTALLSYCGMVLLLSSVCRQFLFNNFSSSGQILLNFLHNPILGTELRFILILGIVTYPVLGYCNLPSFRTRGPKVQKWVFLFFACRELIVHLILVNFFNEFVRKSLAEKCIALLCNQYYF